ncbi:hypothetical protein QTP88_025917 [Uroleucon formosanum]
MASDGGSLGYITCHSGGLVYYSSRQVVRRRRTTLETGAKCRGTGKNLLRPPLNGHGRALSAAGPRHRVHPLRRSAKKTCRSAGAPAPQVRADRIVHTHYAQYMFVRPRTSGLFVVRRPYVDSRRFSSTTLPIPPLPPTTSTRAPRWSFRSRLALPTPKRCLFRFRAMTAFLPTIGHYAAGVNVIIGDGPSSSVSLGSSVLLP